MGFGRRPPDDRFPHVGRELVRELRPHLLRAHEHDPGHVQASATPVELGRHALQVFVHELLDVPPVAGLRPAALIVLSGRLVEVIHDLVQATGLQAVQLSLFASDHGDDRAVGAADHRDERREKEVVADLEPVRGRLGQGEGRPEVVEPCREYRDCLHTVAVELVFEPTRDALEVCLQRAALLVCQILAVDLLRAAQQRVHPRVHVACRRNLGGVEVQIEARRAPLLRAEARKLSQL